MRLIRLLARALPLLALAGCGDPTVTRVVDGRPQEGRFISQQAYAYYGHAVEAEAAGDLAGAKRWLEVATTLDGEGPEVWTRLGALRCRAAPEGAPAPSDALADFERASDADPSFAPLFRERARCLFSRGDVLGATADVERALALDPDDVATSILRAEVLVRAGRGEDAHLALRALTVRRPRSPEVWLALVDVARRTGRDTIARDAAARVAELSPEAAKTLEHEGIAPSPLAAVDAALAAQDLEGARRLAHRAHLPWAELAVRAAALGRGSLAREQAKLVLAADPSAASARIALAAAADLAGDLAGVGAALRGLPPRSAVPSPLARLLLAEVLARRAGLDAASAWLGPEGVGSPIPAGDPLLAAAADRVRARVVGR